MADGRTSAIFTLANVWLWFETKIPTFEINGTYWGEEYPSSRSCTLGGIARSIFNFEYPTFEPDKLLATNNRLTEESARTSRLSATR